MEERGNSKKQVSVVLPEQYLEKIDAWIKENPMNSRQDFIRDSVKQRLEVVS